MDDPSELSEYSRLVGLTGGIATGKTLAAYHFAQSGIPVIDADILARLAVAPNADGTRSTVLDQLVSDFGESILTNRGTLDRGRLADTVFSDPSARRRVEAIVHPSIRALTVGAYRRLSKEKHLFVVYEAALLIETGLATRCDSVVVLTLPRETQLNRLMVRDRLDRFAAEQRVGSQLSTPQRLSAAHYLIDNSRSPRDVQQAVADIIRRLNGQFTALRPDDPFESSA